MWASARFSAVISANFARSLNNAQWHSNVAANGDTH